MHIIDQMPLAQDSFIFCMDTLNHDSAISFEDKAAMVENYRAFFPLWPHNILQLEDALDRINPAYQGRTRLNTCGEVFWVAKGEWIQCADETDLREDSYLHVKTGEEYVIEHSHGFNVSTIKIDSEVVFRGDYLKHNELVQRGVNLLLCKVDALPF